MFDCEPMGASFMLPLILLKSKIQATVATCPLSQADCREGPTFALQKCLADIKPELKAGAGRGPEDHGGCRGDAGSPHAESVCLRRSRPEGDLGGGSHGAPQLSPSRQALGAKLICYLLICHCIVYFAIEETSEGRRKFLAVKFEFTSVIPIFQRDIAGPAQIC